MRKLIGCVISILLFATPGVQSSLAQTAQDAHTEQVRAQVAALGTGKKAKVHLKLRDNTKLKGYVSDAGQNSFTLIDSDGTRTIAYADVTEIRKQRGGISPLTWGIIAGAAAAAIIVGVTVIKPVLCDGGAGC